MLQRRLSRKLRRPDAASPPPDSPASLSDQDYLDIVAHVLRANGFPAGNETLNLARLDDIAIVKSRGGGGRSVPNFALVRVVDGAPARWAPFAYAAWVATVDYAVWGVITAAVFWLAVIVLVASCVVPIIRRRRSRYVQPEPADSKSGWAQ